MSQVAKRKGATNDEMEKRQADSPAKDLKKKVAEKEEKKVPAEKNGDAKPADKTTDKANNKEKAKPAEKDKPAENKDKTKKSEQKEEASKPDKNGKDVPPPTVVPANGTSNAPKQNGSNGVTGSNGVSGSNGTVNGKNGTVNGKNGTVSESEEDVDNDDQFPELAYEDSDVEPFEPQAGDSGRSMTRRSQVTAASTPETPRPLTAETGSKETKVLKMREEASERSLRSKNTPEPAARSSPRPDKKLETPVKEAAADSKTPTSAEKPQPVVVIEQVEVQECDSRKPDTNYSRSRVKVSPYRRSSRLADHTNSSTMANYTGNNTTMEMDISESSLTVETPDRSLNDSYIGAIRSMRGRRSYKLLRDIDLKGLAQRGAERRAVSTTVSEQPSRPTAPVVGRKRTADWQPLSSTPTVSAFPATTVSAHNTEPPAGKRPRLIERVAHLFSHTTHVGVAPIVGINTDLPMTSPVATTSEAETIKSSTNDSGTTPQANRCVVM